VAQSILHDLQGAARVVHVEHAVGVGDDLAALRERGRRGSGRGDWRPGDVGVVYGLPQSGDLSPRDQERVPAALDRDVPPVDHRIDRRHRKPGQLGILADAHRSAIFQVLGG
jgi:hypothetical protein